MAKVTIPSSGGTVDQSMVGMGRGAAVGVGAAGLGGGAADMRAPTISRVEKRPTPAMAQIGFCLIREIRFVMMLPRSIVHTAGGRRRVNDPLAGAGRRGWAGSGE